MDDQSRIAGAKNDLGPLSGWARELADTFVALASDIALVIRSDGIIDAVSQGQEDPGAIAAGDWVGRPWVETVTLDTRPKIERLLEEVRTTGRGRRREINHPAPGDQQVPVAYTAVELGRGGPVLAVGRDLRAVAVIQQRFLEAQRDLERGYWRARQADARYRLLFEVATDAVLLVSGADHSIVECNEAAAQLFAVPVEEILGRRAAFGFDDISRPALESLITAATGTSEPREVTARFICRGRRTAVAVSPLRIGGESMVMLRVRLVETEAADPGFNEAIARLVDGATDCVVVTDSSGNVTVANPAFTRLLKLDRTTSIAGHPIADWLSVPGGPWAELRERIRVRGVVRNVAAQVILQTAEVVNVNMTATLLKEGDQERIGLTIRPKHDHASPPEHLRRELEYLVARIGQSDMAELLLHAGGVVERFLAASALERAGGDRTNAAKLLGVDELRLAQILQPNPEPAG